MSTVYLHTFGCKANQYDTELVREALERTGATIVADPRQADAAVVNSCTVTHAAEGKLRGLVRRIARRRPGVRTVIMGCAAALDDGTLAALPGVARVVEGADTDGVVAALGLGPVASADGLDRFARGGRAWLKIQDGCDEHCTFCATTLARGANRSRSTAAIVAEADRLARRHAEIVLTGVHIGTYGRDRAERNGLGRLLGRLIDQVPDVRFRLSSVEATELDDQLATLMTSAPERLAPHLHAPLQSGSDRVLKRMGRHWYTAVEYRRRIERLAARLPVFGLGADVIVGFPGETDADFAATRAVLADLPFTYVHVFPYSERPGASARRLSRAVPPDVARARGAELRALIDRKTAAHEATRVGGMADVVLTERRRGRFAGLTEDYLTVYFSADDVCPPRFAARLGPRAGAEGLVAERGVPV